MAEESANEIIDKVNEYKQKNKILKKGLWSAIEEKKDLQNQLDQAFQQITLLKQDLDEKVSTWMTCSNNGIWKHTNKWMICMHNSM